MGNCGAQTPFPRGRFGISYQYLIANREVNKSTNGTVGFVQKLSHEAVKGWQEPIDLLFIDADHSYQAVRRDWDDWSPYVKAGGIIALHDSRTLKYPGVLKLVKEITADEGAYRNVEEVATLTVFEKLANDIEQTCFFTKLYLPIVITRQTAALGLLKVQKALL